jgi:ribonuclease HII
LHDKSCLSDKKVNPTPAFLTLCGLDEAGRGPLAGPLIAAAVVFPADFRWEAVNALPLRDSKRLSARQREQIFPYIHDFALTVDTEIIDVADIDRAGIGWANRTAFESLILRLEADKYIVDGNLKLHDLGRKISRYESVVRADQRYVAVSAASVVAKVTRDRIMAAWHEKYPMYGWDHNKGYGTAAHIAALREYGPSPFHRRAFVTTALLEDPPRLPGIDEE